MELSRLPYFLKKLFLISWSGVLMLFLWKIDKMSFYHHYFRIIQEVEVRNSTQIAAENYWSLMRSVVSFQKAPIVLFQDLPSVIAKVVWVEEPILMVRQAFSYQLSPRAP